MQVGLGSSQQFGGTKLTDPDFEDEMIGPAQIGPSGGNRGDLFARPNEKKTAQIANVLEWSSKWEYQPGCQFVRVSREYPKVWEGIPIAGVMEEVLEPFDTDYLLSRWGGGTYKLHAIQLDPDGKSRTTDRKTVTLSGLPLSFRGPDGEPMPLPQSKRVEEAMRRRSHDEEEYEEEEERGGHVSAVDLYYAAQANANNSRGSDPETLEVLRRAQNDANEHMRANMEAQSRLNEQTIRNQDKELERLREQMREKENAAMTPFNYAMQMMESRGNVEMQNMRAQLDAIRNDHNMQMQMIQSEHSRVVESYQRELDRMREDTRLREDQIRSMVSGQYQGQIAALENRALMAEQNASRNVELARSDADRRENQMKMMLESSFESRFHLVNSEKERLQRELTTTRKELSEFRAIAMEVKDPITQLQQMQGLVNAVQGIAGKDESESGDKAPDDFIGKVAHYGPGFAKHFLGPVLQRVDAATEVANRQLHVREQEHDFVNRMNPPPRPIQGPPQMPPPSPQQAYQPPAPPMPQAGPEMYGYEQAMPPQNFQAPPPQDDLQAPAPGEGIIPDGMRRLVEFIDEKMEADVSPADAAGELQLGISLGIIPQETFDDFVGRPVNEVVTDVATAGGVMGLSVVNSPRGIRFCENILTNLRG